MIRLPLDSYGFRALPERPDIVVDLDHESGQVELTIEFEANEMRPHVRRDPLVDRFMKTIDEEPRAVLGMATLASEIKALHEALDRIDDDVTRRLNPDEARALAAALVHFASESERPR